MYVTNSTYNTCKLTSESVVMSLGLSMYFLTTGVKMDLQGHISSVWAWCYIDGTFLLLAYVYYIHVTMIN